MKKSQLKSLTEESIKSITVSPSKNFKIIRRLLPKRTEHIKEKEGYIVYFDISSSSTIMEALQTSNKVSAWRILIIRIRKLLIDMTEAGRIEVYKFLGDGWIIFIKHGYTGEYIMDILAEIAFKFKLEYYNLIYHILEKEIPYQGMTFGIVFDKIYGIKMDGREEWIGRPLNVASRLQGQSSKAPKIIKNKGLSSNVAFIEMFKDGSCTVRANKTKVKLRNISNKFECWFFILDDLVDRIEKSSNFTTSPFK